MTSHREIENGIERDFTRNRTYGAYLDLDRLLSGQHTRAQPPQHNEMLFIRSDRLPPALKRLARVKAIQATGSGVPFLRRALDLTFVHQLAEVRSRIQEVSPAGYHDHAPGGPS